MQPIERVISNPSGQVARRIIQKLIGDEVLAESQIQINQMQRAARAMLRKLQTAQAQAERRMTILMRLGTLLDVGDVEFSNDGMPQIRRNINGLKKDELKVEVEASWRLIEELYKKLNDANQMIEIEILNTGSEG